MNNQVGCETNVKDIFGLYVSHDAQTLGIWSSG
jgi:hypothetical protein